MGSIDTVEGLPVPNPTVSYWQLPPHRLAEHRTTVELPTSTVFDYVIVGSGISGAAIAFKLLSRNPSTSVLMLEARTAASGASGRNGGHCRAGWWLNFKKYAQLYGVDEALKFERLEEGNVKDIADFVKQHKIGCDFEDVTTSDLFATETQWSTVLENIKFREEVRRERPDAETLTQRTVWEGEAARDRMGLSTIVGAVTYPAHTQNPYRLVCRMLELSLEKGLNLQTNTPATNVCQKSTPVGLKEWEVTTKRGAVRAKRVILATNGYTNALHSGLAKTQFLTPARSQVAAIRPGSKATAHPALRGSAGINDFEKGSYFMCRAPGLEGAGDIIYGGGRAAAKSSQMNTTDDSIVDRDIAEYQHHSPSSLFGRASWGADGEVLRDWTGITCYTPDTFPLVGEAPGERGLFMSVGMNGHGMAMAFRCAEALVDLITTGYHPDWLPQMFRLERAWNRRPVLAKAEGLTSSTAEKRCYEKRQSNDKAVSGPRMYQYHSRVFSAA